MKTKKLHLNFDFKNINIFNSLLCEKDIFPGVPFSSLLVEKTLSGLKYFIATIQDTGGEFNVNQDKNIFRNKSLGFFSLLEMGSLEGSILEK